MFRSMVNGFIGACTLTAAHQVLRKLSPDAPRLDTLGQEGVTKLTDAAGIKLTDEQLKKAAIVGDILSNTMYFSQVGAKPGIFTLVRGVSLGLTAGAGSVYLPKKLHLSSGPTKKTPRTAAMTVGIYALAGLSAAAAAYAFGRKK